MFDLLKQYEAVPVAYPDAPTRLSDDAAALDASMIWARIESYIAHRFTPREVVWIVEGEGDWCPNLGPLEITAEEVWQDDAWQAASVFASPYGGYRMTAHGVYRFTGTVGGGGGDVPAPVSEAFRRLAEYLADDPGTAGASSTSVAIGPIQEELERNPNWVARAMQHSGAADLLRTYRRV